ncbi:MAG: adenosylcobinamide-phosphate synthase CbiB [Cyanobacteria bacterium J06614_10]
MRVAGKPLKVRALALWFELEGLGGMPLGSSAVLAGRSLLVLVAAACLDFWIGDPWGWLHPVQVMGEVIDRYRKWAIAWSPPAWLMRLVGVGLTALLVVGTALLSAVLLGVLNLLSPVLSAGVEVILLASCFAGRSLRRAADDVLAALPQASATDKFDDAGNVGDFEPGSLVHARERLALYVGRETAQLSAEEIRRAVMETVSENAIDGVLAPLFYALVGSAFGVFMWSGQAGSALTDAGLSLAVPMALAYKAASTLDSMVGYRDVPYTDLGWCSARFEDVLTWLPCRLSVLTIAVLSGRPWQVLAICWRDARADPSPNAGWSECVYAAALGVQLGGANTYRGKLAVKPTLGDATRPITDAVIAAALSITRRCFLIGLGLGCALLLAMLSVTTP